MEDLHDALLSQTTFAVKRGVVITAEERMRRLTDDGIVLFGRERFNERFGGRADGGAEGKQHVCAER